MQTNLLTLLCVIAIIGVLFAVTYSLKLAIVSSKEEMVIRTDRAKHEIIESITALKYEISRGRTSGPAIDTAFGRLDTALDDLTATPHPTPEPTN